MELMSAKDAAIKWEISERRVDMLCSENQVPLATKVGKIWTMPENTPNPINSITSVANYSNTTHVKPFIKWAGGKSQLIKQIQDYYPFATNKDITKYVEPFVGGGAILFDILNKFKLNEMYINDINCELINTYKTIRDNPYELIQSLEELQNQFIPMDTDNRKKYYYEKKTTFNQLKSNNTLNIEIASLFIFLNRRCFNGLYRVNKKGLFNVPIGSYTNPLICDKQNLKNISHLLKKISITCGDYKDCKNFIDEKTFVYIDPPYRPLSKTSSFTSYTNVLFDDNEQRGRYEY